MVTKFILPVKKPFEILQMAIKTTGHTMKHQKNDTHSPNREDAILECPKEAVR